MKESHDRKHDLLIERLCEIFAALYQGKTIDKAWLCDQFGITERTAYRDLARLGHILDQVSPGRYKLSSHLLPSLPVSQLAAVEKEHLKAFELARIDELKMGNRRFVPPPKAFTELENSVGIRFGVRMEALLQVSAHAAEYVSRRSLFPSQRIIEQHDDGSLTLSTAISDPHTLFRWLRYWLPDIGILSPQSLREQFEQDLHMRYARTFAEQ